jgi:hypothetical protein
MAIVLNVANTPAAVTATNYTAGATITTASFTPPNNSLVVAISGNCWNTNYSGTPANTILYSDSLSGTWTPVNSQNAGASGALMCSTAYRIGTGSAMTVTATSVDSLSKDMLLTVLVYTGAAITSTIATSLFTGTASTTNFTQQTVTTTTTGSQPVIIVTSDNNDPLVVNANTTERGHVNDTTVNAISVGGYATNLTTTPGSLSLGWTGSTAIPQTVAIIEVMPAAAAAASNAPPDRVILQAVKSAAFF